MVEVTYRTPRSSTSAQRSPDWNAEARQCGTGTGIPNATLAPTSQRHSLTAHAVAVHQAEQGPVEAQGTLEVQ
jgi:hypothetical protein